jgi:hypothetical protein
MAFLYLKLKVLQAIFDQLDDRHQFYLKKFIYRNLKKYAKQNEFE